MTPQEIGYIVMAVFLGFLILTTKTLESIVKDMEKDPDVQRVHIDAVETLDRFKLKILFSNGVSKIFDTLPLLDYTSYRNLRDDYYFRKVMIDNDGETLRWREGEEFDVSMLYVRGV